MSHPWTYHSFNFAGNIHEATKYLNEYWFREHPHDELVSLHTMTGGRNTIFVVRTPRRTNEQPTPA